jgi:hypothetical protein
LSDPNKRATGAVRSGVAFAGRLVAGLARALVDADRRREFSRRLLEYHQYEQFLGAVVEPRKTLRTFS